MSTLPMGKNGSGDYNDLVIIFNNVFLLKGIFG